MTGVCLFTEKMQQSISFIHNPPFKSCIVYFHSEKSMETMRMECSEATLTIGKSPISSVVLCLMEYGWNVVAIEPRPQDNIMHHGAYQYQVQTHHGFAPSMCSEHHELSNSAPPIKVKIPTQIIDVPHFEEDLDITFPFSRYFVQMRRNICLVIQAGRFAESYVSQISITPTVTDLWGTDKSLPFYEFSLLFVSSCIWE